MSTFDKTRLATLHDVMADHVARGNAGGLAWLAARGDHVEVGVAGRLTRGEDRPIERNSIFRIASMTKPMAAVGTLILIEECRLRLDDAVDDLLPELADRRVLVDGRGPLDGETVPAHRPITVRDVLTFQLGLGMDFEAPWPQPLIEAMAGLALGSGPPDPRSPEPDEWMRRFSTLPLLYQPGEKWLYNVGSDVLGVLIARASGQPLDLFLSERVFEPLGMRDTTFFVDERGTAHVLLRGRPSQRRAVPLRRSRRPMDEPPGVSLRRRRSRLDRRRRARLRADARERRTAARWLAPHLRRIGPGDDHRPHRRRAWRRGSDPGRFSRMGIRGQRAGAPHWPSPLHRQLWMGRRARFLVGQRSERATRRHDLDHGHVHRGLPRSRGHPRLLDLPVRRARRLKRRRRRRRRSGRGCRPSCARARWSRRAVRPRSRWRPAARQLCTSSAWKRRPSPSYGASIHSTDVPDPTPTRVGRCIIEGSSIQPSVPEMRAVHDSATRVAALITPSRPPV